MGNLVAMRATREINQRANALPAPEESAFGRPQAPREWAELAHECLEQLHGYTLDGTIDRGYTALFFMAKDQLDTMLSFGEFDGADECSGNDSAG